MGQAVAVLRVRGNHMILATIGLVVGALYVGMFIGLFAVSIYISTYADVGKGFHALGDRDSSQGAGRRARPRRRGIRPADARPGGAAVVTATARGWLLEGPLSREQADRLTRDLLVDPLVETGVLGALNEHAGDGRLATVLSSPASWTRPR